MNALSEKFTGRPLEFSSSDKSEIELRAKEKYSSWEYIYGSSKALSKTARDRFDGGCIEISFDSENGVINDIKISGDFFADGDIGAIERSLVGCRLDLNDLISVIENSDCRIHGITSSEIAETILK